MVLYINILCFFVGDTELMSLATSVVDLIGERQSVTLLFVRLG